MDESARPSAPSSSSESQPKVPEAANAQTECEPFFGEQFFRSADEDSGARVLASPVKPTQAMIDEHEVHRSAFRAWRSFCVRGRAVSVGHSHDCIIDPTTIKPSDEGPQSHTSASEHSCKVAGKVRPECWFRSDMQGAVSFKVLNNPSNKVIVSVSQMRKAGYEVRLGKTPASLTKLLVR